MPLDETLFLRLRTADKKRLERLAAKESKEHGGPASVSTVARRMIVEGLAKAGAK